MDSQIILDEIDILNDKINKLKEKEKLRKKATKNIFPYNYETQEILLTSEEIINLRKYISMKEQLQKQMPKIKTR